MPRTRIKAVIFDWGHTIMDEVKYKDVPLRSRPIRLMPGVLQTLPQIKLRMGIWANTRKLKSNDVRAWLKRAGINDYFACVVTSEDVSFRKPHRRFFSSALKKCRLRKNEVLFVGNQLNTDIRGARDYGIANVYLSGKTHRSPDETLTLKHVQPTYTIGALAALPRLLKRLQLPTVRPGAAIFRKIGRAIRS